MTIIETENLAYIRANLPIPEYYIDMSLDCITVRLTTAPTGTLGIRPWAEVTRGEHGYNVTRCELRTFGVHREPAQRCATLDDVVAHLHSLLRYVEPNDVVMSSETPPTSTK
jgi:hypothetical protein